MSELIESFEIPQESWPFEEWRCSRGVDCCFDPPAPLGHWLAEDYNGREYDIRAQPFVAVFDDGTCKMVCEDCLLNFEEARREAALTQHERSIQP